MTIREYVDVSPHPTVVRLDHLQTENSRWISESYYLSSETSRHMETLRTVLGRETGSGVFLIGHYGSGKSHFLAYLTQQVRNQIFPRSPAVLPISLLNYKAGQPLEWIVERELGLAADESRDQQDRRSVWKEVARRNPGGLLIVIDELSEYLRSKPSPQSFNEDLRFLQFLGEWADGHRFWVIAALQEQIEHTGEIEYDLFRKIKDRYPLRLLLTPSHVRDLIARRILRKKPGYESAVEKVVQQLKQLYPGASLDLSQLCEIYPIHPVTLDLLEEVRDRFSQARGIVEFTLTQLLGSSERGIAPFLSRPWGHLLTPDLIVDHFADLFEIQPEFLPIAQRLLPYFRSRMPDLFSGKTQQELAWRLLKLMILVHLSPRREGLRLNEAAEWLLFKVSTIDPERNQDVIRKTLESLAAQASYVKQSAGVYTLDLEDNSNEYLDQLLTKTTSELRERGDFVFENLVPLLDQAGFNPFALPRGRWHARKVRWHFHDWDLHVYFGGGAPAVEKTAGRLAFQLGVPWGSAAAAGCARIVPRRIEPSPDIVELSALCHLRERPLPARVLTRIEERIASRSGSFCSLVRSAYVEASVIDANGTAAGTPLASLQGDVGDWLQSYGEWLLRQIYPLFERFAPVSGPLPKEAYRQFMTFASEKDLGAQEAPDFVKLIREGYLVPMGLMQRRGPEYVTDPRLESNELVRLLTPILKHHPSPVRVAEHMSAPVYGLVRDQIELLLLFLLIQGEVDIVKGERSYRETYMTLPNPLLYDKVLPGHALNVNELHDLQTLCEGFRIPVPKHWSVLAQKKAVEQLRKFGRNQRDLLSGFVISLREAGEAQDVIAQTESIISKWLALENGDHELQGFQHFEFGIGSAQRFVAEATAAALLPQRFDGLLRETQRLHHLLSDPAIRSSSDPDIATRAEALGSVPSLSQPEAVEGWLSAARQLYQAYQKWYRDRHEHWRAETASHPIWTYRIPNVAESRHLMTRDLAREMESLITRAKTQRCPGLSSIEFHPVCRCGFDGSSAPLSQTLQQFESKAERLKTDLARFFQQDRVKEQIRRWAAQGIEVSTPTLSYLEGKSAYPDVQNVALFDQYLSGLELVKTVPVESVAELLAGHVWEKHEFMRALEQFFERAGPRISFRREEHAMRKELIAWCYERALALGQALPPVFSAAEQVFAADVLDWRWVAEASLRNVTNLQLGEPVVLRILSMILEGTLAVPDPGAQSGPVAAARELLQPSCPHTAAELERRVTCLYLEHERFMKLQPARWLAVLDRLAKTDLSSAPELLETRLAAHLDAQWIVVDCLGAPLADAVRRVCGACMPSRQLLSTEFALVSEQTSTDAFYSSLLERNFTKPFEKMNAIDDLIHERRLSFQDLTRLASAELEIAFKRLMSRLDPGKPILIFGDHGFRLAPDGNGFTHGGRSTLERLTVVLLAM